MLLYYMCLISHQFKKCDYDLSIMIFKAVCVSGCLCVSVCEDALPHCRPVLALNDGLAMYKYICSKK